MKDPTIDGQGFKTDDPRSLGNILQRRIKERFYEGGVATQKILNRIHDIKGQKNYMIERYFWASNIVTLIETLTAHVRPLLLLKVSEETPGLSGEDHKRAVDLAIAGMIVDALDIWHESVKEFESKSLGA